MKNKTSFLTLTALVSLAFGATAQNTFPTNGSVGIGTSSPAVTLDVVGPAGASHGMRLLASDNHSVFFHPSLAAGNYGNGIVQPGDSAIIFTDGSFGGNPGFVRLRSPHEISGDQSLCIFDKQP